jgi:hypothetical protein
MSTLDHPDEAINKEIRVVVVLITVITSAFPGSRSVLSGK